MNQFGYILFLIFGNLWENTTRKSGNWLYYIKKSCIGYIFVFIFIHQQIEKINVKGQNGTD